MVIICSSSSPSSSSSSSSFLYRNLSRLPRGRAAFSRLLRGRAACPKPVHKGLGLPGVTVQLHAKPPGSSAQGRGHTARLPNMTKLQTMALPASARLNALLRASGGGGIKRFCGNGGGATAAATRKASTRNAWAREAHPSPAAPPPYLEDRSVCMPNALEQLWSTKLFCLT